MNQDKQELWNRVFTARYSGAGAAAPRYLASLGSQGVTLIETPGTMKRAAVERHEHAGNLVLLDQTAVDRIIGALRRQEELFAKIVSSASARAAL